MTYAALTNWKYDKKLYHNIQSGPQRTADDLNLTDTYELVSSGYQWSEGEQQSYYAVNYEGADFGIITAGPPNAFIESLPDSSITKQWGYSTDWRQVPAMISGWWSNYDDYFQRASGVLTVYNGYRRQGLISTANSTVQTAFGPEPGLRDRGAYTYFGAAVPDNQFYSPFETPAGNTAAQGITGGPNTYERVKFPMLTNPTNDSSGSRAAWEYHKPVYCQTFVESVRSTAPGATGGVVRNMYRGKSSRYVPNYAGGYGVLGEGVRNLVRTFSASVNSSNQKGI